MNPFNPYQHFGFLTNRIARLISNSMASELEKEGYDFPVSCIGVLADLWAKDGVNQKDLCVSLIKTKSSINKMLTALEEAGLIIKVEDPQDARGRKIFLTNKGKEMQAKIETHSTCADERLLQNVSRAELETSKKVLAKYYELLSEHSCLGGLS